MKGESLLAAIAIFLLRQYRKYLSPLMGPHCRFFPSCSEYAQGAFTKKGFLQGLWLTSKRLLKCHPFHPGGFDFIE